jgi:hypothetical protein
MEANLYPAVNSKKTIFMKHVDNDFIIHGLFVNDIMHIPTNNTLEKESMHKYSKNFNITRGVLMESFLGVEVEQSDDMICLNLDKYIKEIDGDYSKFSAKTVGPKIAPNQPAVILTCDYCPIVLDPVEQRYNQSMIAKLQCAATWICFNI